MLPNQAFFLAGLVGIPSMMYLLYRSILPYEAAMPDPRLAGALFYPGIAGVALGLAHVALDYDLIGGGFGGIAYLAIYPAIEAYAVIVIFNRNFFYKQPAMPLYFAVGGAALSFGLGLVETARSFLAAGRDPADLGVGLEMLALATAFVLFHTSKGLLLGTYFVEGARTRGILLAVLLEVPFGLFYLTIAFERSFGVVPADVLAVLFLYAAVTYYMVWHVFFPKRMPEAMRKALKEERKRIRRLRAARERN